MFCFPVNFLKFLRTPFVTEHHWWLLLYQVAFLKRRLMLRIFVQLPNAEKNRQLSLRERCPYSELFWFAFFRIRTEYGEIRSIQSISPYSVQIRENADQNNSEYGHFLRSVCFLFLFYDYCKKYIDYKYAA